MRSVGQLSLAGGVGLVVVWLCTAPVLAQSTSIVYDKPIDEAFRLRVATTHAAPAAGGCCATEVRVTIVANHDLGHPWEIATLSEPYEADFTVQRADRASVVLSRTESIYGVDHGRTKLFFDIPTKRLLKRIDYESNHDIDLGDDAAAAFVLGVRPASIGPLRSSGVLRGRKDQPRASGDRVRQFAFEIELPEPFVRHPLPQTTYREFARARPHRVADGYTQESTEIDEVIGAYAAEGDRLWFGKAFYDGEGVSGVGAIGSLDHDGHYEWLRIPQLFAWSTSALLVERDSIVAGRATHPEGADRSGGLLRYDRRSHRVAVFDVPGVIHSIVRADGVLFAGTNDGLYGFRNGKRTRFRAEPDINGHFVVVSESL